MKKTVAMLLSLIMILSLVACGNVKNNEIQETANSDSKEDYNSTKDEKETVKDPTLDEAQVRLVYAEGNYLLLAYYGRQHDIGMHFCTSEGQTRVDLRDPLYWKFDTGWRLVVTTELPDDIDVSNIALSVTYYDEESHESQASRIFSDFGSPMSESELKEIGVGWFNGHAANVNSYGSIYKKRIEIVIQFNWWGADYGTKASEWPFTVDDFKFFISDGTPLDEAYEGYEMEIDAITVGDGKICVELTGDTDATNEDFDQLVALQPYMIFTGSDGSTQRIELLDGYRN